MEEKFCTGCGKSFTGEDEFCEECLAKKAEAASSETEVNNTEEVEAPVSETAEETFEMPNDSEFYVDYEEDVIQKPNSTSKIIGMIFSILATIGGFAYVGFAWFQTKMQAEQMAQYGMSAGASIMDYLPLILMGGLILCGLIGGVLPKKSAKASVILTALPTGYMLFTGFQMASSIISALTSGQGQQIGMIFWIIYSSFIIGAVLMLISCLLHASYVKYKYAE